MAIQPLAAERLPLSGLRRRYAVRHRKGFDRHNPGWLTFARRLRERDLAPVLADLTRRFYRNDGEPPTSEALPPEPPESPESPQPPQPPIEERSGTWSCAACGNEYDPAYGDPLGEVAPDTAFAALPPVGAARYATARSPTINPAARPGPAPGTDRQTLIRLAQGRVLRVLICPVPATDNRVISVGVTSRGDEPMKIPILIEVTEDHRFRATGGEPFAAAVEGDTPEAALDKMRRGILERMAQGGRIAALDLPGGSNPWHQVFGMFQDDPLFDEWQQAINDNRRIVNDSEEGA